MGFGFKKSIRVGKNTRVNLSKSGVGLSTGVKGARVGVNKKGTYVAGGKNGMYYRKQFAGNSKSKEPQEQSGGLSFFQSVGVILSLIWNIGKLIFFLAFLLLLLGLLVVFIINVTKS